MAVYNSNYTGAEIDAAVGAVAGKAERDTDAVEGNMAEFDDNGNPVDSGIASGDVATSDDLITTKITDPKTGMTLDNIIKYITPYVDNEYYIDMGLPSGIMWAKRNIDVTQADKFAASEYTYDASYFSWGNTNGYNPTGTTFDYNFDATTYASTPGAALTGNIPPSQDSAHVNCGTPWRMPTTDEFKELFDNCDFVDANGDVIPSTTANKLVTMSSVVGIRLKSKINGGILFFPCSGYGVRTDLYNCGSYGTYFASSFYSNSEGESLYFNSNTVRPQDNNPRTYGFPIRPVM